MDALHWFLDPVTKHYVDFEGRVGRQEFWMFVLFSFGIQVAFDIVGLDAISMLIALALFVPSIAIGARRLHDVGKSGWWQLLGLIPVIGWIILIIWEATAGEETENAFGPVPPGKVPSSDSVAPTAPTATAAAATSVDTTNTNIETTPKSENDTQSDN